MSSALTDSFDVNSSFSGVYSPFFCYYRIMMNCSLKAPYSDITSLVLVTMVSCTQTRRKHARTRIQITPPMSCCFVDVFTFFFQKNLICAMKRPQHLSCRHSHTLELMIMVLIAFKHNITPQQILSQPVEEFDQTGATHKVAKTARALRCKYS